MRIPTKLLVAGAVIVPVVMATFHRHDRHSHAHARRGCDQGWLLDRPEWRGLTEDEARARLAERLDPASDADDRAIDEAIAALEERGYLAPTN